MRINHNIEKQKNNKREKGEIENNKYNLDVIKCRKCARETKNIWEKSMASRTKNNKEITFQCTEVQ